MHHCTCHKVIGGGLGKDKWKVWRFSIRDEIFALAWRCSKEIESDRDTIVGDPRIQGCSRCQINPGGQELSAPTPGESSAFRRGRAQTQKWPVLHYGNVPRVDLKAWDFRIFGLVEKEWRCGWEEFRALPWIDVQCDIHCVTRWSRLNNVFQRTEHEDGPGKGGSPNGSEVCPGALRAGVHDQPAAVGVSG